MLASVLRAGAYFHSITNSLERWSILDWWVGGWRLHSLNRDRALSFWFTEKSVNLSGPRSRAWENSKAMEGTV